MASLSGSIEDLIGSAFVAGPLDVCGLMESPDGTTIQREMRVRSLKSMPFSHLTMWLPEETGRSFAEDEMRRQPLLAVRRRVFDAKGQVVELINGLYRPYTYEGQMEFDPSAGSSAQVWTARVAGDELSA